MYGKIFSSMFSGSLHGHWQAIVTFQQMIVLADKDGTIEITPSALSATTSIPLDIIDAGIAVLEAPDAASRTPDEEGRRIIRINPDRPWGWHITNYAHYRMIRTAEERREYHKNYWHKRKDKTGEEKKIKARLELNKAIARGEIKRGKCEECGWHVTEGHHSNYEKPLDVRWLCVKHHEELHHSQPSLNKAQLNKPIVEAEAEADTVNQLQGHFSNEKSTPVGDKEEKEPVPFSKIVDLYHEKLPELPRCVKLTNQRKGYIRQRWQEDLPDMEEWSKYFEIVKQSKFLLGKVKGSDNRPPFRADLAWLCKPENIVKIIEGKYHRG